MNRIALLIAAAALAGCDEVSVAQPSGAADDAAFARRVVEAYFDEMGETASDIRIGKVTDEGFCGTALVGGEAASFYADVVDEEVFVSDGPMATIYQLTCG